MFQLQVLSTVMDGIAYHLMRRICNTNLVLFCIHIWWKIQSYWRVLIEVINKLVVYFLDHLAVYKMTTGCVRQVHRLWVVFDNGRLKHGHQCMSLPPGLNDCNAPLIGTSRVHCTISAEHCEWRWRCDHACMRIQGIPSTDFRTSKWGQRTNKESK